ncbi:MAG TPA: PrsW family glutamic-type intramembrane protease, partial [Ktedonobacteraceae bacterium]
MSQYYGVLRVVRVLPAVHATGRLQEQYPTGWLPEERQVYLLSRQETTIGRALDNDLVLMDPTISREHARLVRDDQEWCVYNITSNNVIRVNGHPVPNGGSMSLHAQDFLTLGGITLQLVAPQTALQAADDAEQRFPSLDTLEMTSLASQDGNGAVNGQPSHEAPAALGAIDANEVEFVRYFPASPEQGSFVDTPPIASDRNWENTSEGLLDVGVTLQFALPRGMMGRTRWLVLWMVIAFMLVGVLIVVALSRLGGISSFSHSSLSDTLLVLTIPLLPAIGINVLVNFIDRFEREPWFLRLAAFLWGAIIAIPTAFLIEQNIDLSLLNVTGSNYLLQSLFDGLNAGITEETIKGLGLLLLFVVLRDEFDNVTDGIVYGALIGAGFAMVENFSYFSQYSKDSLLFMIVGRIVLGWLSHSTFTVCFGAALGYVRHTHIRWQQIVFPLIGYVCAVGLHSAFDFIYFFARDLVLAFPGNQNVELVSLTAIVGNYIPPFITQIVLMYVLMRALMHESAVIREFLAYEVSDGVVLIDEYVLLQNSFRRTKVERQVLWKYGVRQWLRVKALYQTEIGLAFRKWHVSMGDKPKLGYLQPEDAYRHR